MAEIRTNVYLLSSVAQMMDEDVETYGTMKRVMNAALVMFHSATPEQQVAKIKAVAAIEKGKNPEPEQIGEQGRRLTDAERAAVLQAKEQEQNRGRRGKRKIGQTGAA